MEPLQNRLTENKAQILNNTGMEVVGYILQDPKEPSLIATVCHGRVNWPDTKTASRITGVPNDKG